MMHGQQNIKIFYVQ